MEIVSTMTIIGRTDPFLIIMGLHQNKHSVLASLLMFLDELTSCICPICCFRM